MLRSDPLFVPGADREKRMTFDFTVNLGHIITIVVLMVGGIVSYEMLTAQINDLNVRTADYLAIRDRVLADSGRVDGLQTASSIQSTALASISTTLTGIREDIASIKATLRINGTP